MFTLTVVSAMGSASFASESSRTRRVLVVGIDGLRPDGVLRYAPKLRRFGERHLATYKSKVAIPISAPSWATIFSGLSYEHTGITNNAFTGATLSKKDNQLAAGKRKTVFAHLKNHGLEYAVISTGTWNGIQRIANYGGLNNPHDHWARASNNRTRNEHKAQSEGIAVAMKALDTARLRLVTFYTHHVDNAGHIYGHDPDVLQYANAIQQCDADVAKLLDAIERREKRYPEDWLILITTDHGGSSRWKLEQSRKGLAVLSKMDRDKQVNAGIPQRHLEGVHGLREDGIIDHEQTTTFILMKHGKRKGTLGRGRTNQDITPTVLHYLLPKREKLRKRLDGRSLIQ